MPKKRHAKTFRRATPVGFLAELGILQKSPEQVFTADYWKMVGEAGGDRRDLDLHGPFSAEAGSVFFVTEEVAKHSLSAEYWSFLGTLDFFQGITKTLPKPRRLADLGGGIGIVSLYFARCNPECQATVYDHAPQQLELGRKWAAERGIHNIKFVRATYKELAAGPQGSGNDLVLFLRGLDLRISAPKSDDKSLMIENCPRARPKPFTDLKTAIAALARLMSPEGIGVIAAVWSAWGLVHLFEACRCAGLGVDWRLSRYELELQDGKLVLGDGYIFVRKGMPHLGKDSYEDAQGFLSASKLPKEPECFTQEDIAERTKGFDNSVLLLVAEGVSPTDGFERLRLMQQNGLLLLVVSSLDGDCGGIIRSLTGVSCLLDEIQSYLDDWQENGELKVWDIREPFKSFVDFCTRN
jgi:tRNA1(Val) A37 N6-methylase TrmN6